jgi:hypothetical protein
MEPDGWDVPIDVPAVEKQVTAPATKPEQGPVPTAKPEQAPVKSEPGLKVAAKPTDKAKRTDEKPHAEAKKKAASAKSKPQAATEGLESELSGEFFAISASATTHVEEYHEPDELIDERHMRSISPEVRARRARYRIVVLLLVVGMILLLAAAIALKLLHRH